MLLQTWLYEYIHKYEMFSQDLIFSCSFSIIAFQNNSTVVHSQNGTYLEDGVTCQVFLSQTRAKLGKTESHPAASSPKRSFRTVTEFTRFFERYMRALDLLRSRLHYRTRVVPGGLQYIPAAFGEQACSSSILWWRSHCLFLESWYFHS